MKSIGLKLWSGMMALVVMMLIVLWLFQIVFLEKFYMTMQTNAIQKKTLEIASQYEGLSSITDIPLDENSTETLKAFVYTYNLNVEVTNLSGETLYKLSNTQESQNGKVMEQSMIQVMAAVKQGNMFQTTYEHPRFGNSIIVIGVPITINEKLAGAFIVHAPLPPVSDTANILKQQLLYITIILLIIAFFIAWVISRQLSKPILKINEVAKAIAKGNLDVTIPITSQDEIGQLATTMEEMAVELKKTDLLRKELIGNVSHELRTPLSIIRGYAETIRDVSGDNREKRDKHLATIIHESERLSHLIDDILKFSQLEVGAIELDQRCFAAQELLGRVESQFSNLAQNRNITFHVDVKLAVCVIGDFSKLEQVFVNLVSNAFNHTPDGGTIEVYAIVVNNDVKFVVSDNGEGVPKEEIASIWDRYYRASNRDERVGSGLGLAIVKNILTAHQVAFGVESEINKGSMFWFMLKQCEKEYV